MRYAKLCLVAACLLGAPASAQLKGAAPIVRLPPAPPPVQPIPIAPGPGTGLTAPIPVAVPIIIAPAPVAAAPAPIYAPPSACYLPDQNTCAAEAAQCLAQGWVNETYSVEWSASGPYIWQRAYDDDASAAVGGECAAELSVCLQPIC